MDLVSREDFERVEALAETRPQPPEEELEERLKRLEKRAANARRKTDGKKEKKMMSTPLSDIAADDDANPLDLIEELAEVQAVEDLAQPRKSLMVLQVPGQGVAYEICLEWQEEFSALLFAPAPCR